jgi:phospholipid/cholesterol/gamma-HCH transport system substrate-binding protein
MKTPPKGISRELQVGFFVFIALLVVAAFSFRITDTPIFYSGTRITAYLDDATGLFRKSKVKMAGIDIGLVTDIRLVEGRAQIELTIDRGIEIPVDSKVIPRPLGILGDKYLEIALPEKPLPKTLDSSEDGGREPQSIILYEGSWLRRLPKLMWPEAHAQSSSRGRSTRPPTPTATKTLSEGDVISSENTGATIDDLTRQLGEVTSDLKVISSTIRKLVEGQDVTTPMGRTLRNTEELTANLNKVIQENRRDMKQITSSLAKLTRSLEDVASDDPKSGLSKEIQNLAKSADRLAETVHNIESITGKIDRGEGTLGRLVNDPTTASEFNKALMTLNAALDRAERTRIFLEAVPEYNLRGGDVKTFVGLRLSPRDNTSYIGQFVVRPEGTTTTTITRTRVDGGPETVTEEVVQNPAGLAFSFQYLKRFWGTAFRVGLFENTGGAAIDQFMLNDRLRFSGEIFDFRQGTSPNLKLTAAARLMGIFVVQAGVERLASGSPHGFIGAGLSFSDEDLKTILLLPGVP